MPEAHQEYLNVLSQPRGPFWGLSKRQKRLLVYGTLGGAGLYFLYKAYRSDTLQALIELRKQFQGGIQGYGEAFALSSELSKRVMADLNAFLNSDEDELPQSLRQLAKLARSEEVGRAASKFAEAAANGVMSALGPTIGQQDGQDMLDRVLEALTTDKGSNLVSLAVSMACRSTVQAFCEFGGSSGTSGPGFWQQLLEFGTTPKGEQLYMNCAGTFIREGTKVYMGSLEGVSGWEDFLNSLCKPERALAIDRMTRAFVNELVVSYLRKTRYGVRQDLKHSKAAFVRSEKGVSQPLSPDTAHSNNDGATVDSAVIHLKPRKTVSFDNVTSPALFPSLGSVSDWSSAMIQMSKHAEIRALIVSVARTATAESIRSSLFTVKDMITGKRQTLDSASLSMNPISSEMTDITQMSNRSLGAILLAVFMPLVAFLAGRRSGIE